MIAYWPTNNYILNIMIIASAIVLGVVLLAWFITWLSKDVGAEFTPSKPIGKVTYSEVLDDGLVIKTDIWNIPWKDAIKKYNDIVFNCPCSFVGTGGWTISNKEMSKLIHYSKARMHTKEENDILNHRLERYKRWELTGHGMKLIDNYLIPGPAIISPRYTKAELNTYLVYLGAWNDFKLIPKWAAREVTDWMVDAQTGHLEPKFDGKVTVRVRFRNKAEYQKFRKYILKTGWEYDMGHPQYECMDHEFHTCDDLVSIDKEVIQLLQLGFDVWTCNYQLTDVDPAELESPSEDDDFCDADDEDYDVPERFLQIGG